MLEILIIVIFISFITYREWQNLKHIKDLELKAFSNTPQEYATLKNIDESVKKIQPIEEDELIDPFDVKSADAVKGTVK